MFSKEEIMEKTEYEVRILNIDPQAFIQKLESLGATKEGDYHYRRCIFHFRPDIPEKWIRLRTNGKKTTLTIKHVQEKTISGTKEKEIVVSDFEMTKDIISDLLGYGPDTTQENKRTRYFLDGVELDIDTWPLIPTYVEIEGHSEAEVLETVKKLGYTESDCVTLDVQSVYQKIYGIDISNMPTLHF